MGGWSVRQLRRQIDSQFYERAALSHDKMNLERPRDEATELTSPSTPKEAIRDPDSMYLFQIKLPRAAWSKAVASKSYSILIDILYNVIYYRIC